MIHNMYHEIYAICSVYGDLYVCARYMYIDIVLHTE